MKLIQTPLADCFVLEPTLHKDDRGYFFESFNKRVFHALSGFDVEFVQDNQALSQYGTVRGLHFQRGSDAQAKLVRVLQGRVLDVAVDLRPQSSTYMQHFCIELSAENNLQLFVPRGFAHGYSVLENNTIFHYKCDNYYNKSAEGGLHVLNNNLQIDWQIPETEMLISEKDLLLEK
ncbi:MAG: dTDP-4-dehydrorhamnose 3,5-epimerase [Bacteroidetes bacterium]|nr:dTDP-4-dehydrorhamnose 3,5-epimerase [Bacteroidota bacterium]MBK8144255.1 dTDP-4-dehydrorhamnose 3,5-epimerase [Bacteroidota bacterium]MBP6314203.1 dTDP-4-dehydrorhamnose 3,5-epimerase [Chitinophagaceae bacterium]